MENNESLQEEIDYLIELGKKAYKKENKKDASIYFNLAKKPIKDLIQIRDFKKLAKSTYESCTGKIPYSNTHLTSMEDKLQDILDGNYPDINKKECIQYTNNLAQKIFKDSPNNEIGNQILELSNHYKEKIQKEEILDLTPYETKKTSQAQKNYSVPNNSMPIGDIIKMDYHFKKERNNNSISKTLKKYFKSLKDSKLTINFNLPF